MSKHKMSNLASFPSTISPEVFDISLSLGKMFSIVIFQALKSLLKSVNINLFHKFFVQAVYADQMKDKPIFAKLFYRHL